MKFEELDPVALTVDKPKVRLVVGDCGTIVMVYNKGEGYEVEFFQFNDGGGLLLTLYPHEIEPCNETGRKSEQG